MITVLKSTETGLQQLENPIEGCWVNVLQPKPDEITRLAQQYHIPEDFLTYPLDIDEPARTEKENGSLLIGLRMPIFQGKTASIPYATVPLAIIMTEQTILTVYNAEVGFINQLAQGRTLGLSTGKQNRFVLHLLYRAANAYLQFLREINHEVDALENRLQRSLRNQEVLELLKYQKSLTLFTTALRSNELVIGRLQRSHIFQKYEEDQDLLDDVLTELGQAIEMTTIASDILSQMMDAFASIISNNLNMVMKFLASITIILALPTLVASIYGMNIGLPIQEKENAFFVVMGVTLIVTIGVVIIFRRRDWF